MDITFTSNLKNAGTVGATEAVAPAALFAIGVSRDRGFLPFLVIKVRFYSALPLLPLAGSGGLEQSRPYIIGRNHRLS